MQAPVQDQRELQSHEPQHTRHRGGFISFCISAGACMHTGMVCVPADMQTQIPEQVSSFKACSLMFSVLVTQKRHTRQETWLWEMDAVLAKQG